MAVLTTGDKGSFMLKGFYVATDEYCLTQNDNRRSGLHLHLKVFDTYEEAERHAIEQTNTYKSEHFVFELVSQVVIKPAEVIPMKVFVKPPAIDPINDL